MRSRKVATARHCRRGLTCAYPAIRDGWLPGARKLKSLGVTAQRCRRNDLRRCPDGTVVEYIDQRSMKPRSIHRLVQKVV